MESVTDARQYAAIRIERKELTGIESCERTGIKDRCKEAAVTI